MSNNNLNNEKCEPCKGGVEPLARAESERFLSYLADGWQLSKDNIYIQKEFKFSNFKKALALVNLISEIAEQEKHHPDIAFGWGYVKVVIQTHAINGLHKNDFILAAKIDEINIES